MSDSADGELSNQVKNVLRWLFIWIVLPVSEIL